MNPIFWKLSQKTPCPEQVIMKESFNTAAMMSQDGSASNNRTKANDPKQGTNRHNRSHW
jgi:hypothetical protein